MWSTGDGGDLAAPEDEQYDIDEPEMDYAHGDGYSRDDAYPGGSYDDDPSPSMAVITDPSTLMGTRPPTCPRSAVRTPAMRTTKHPRPRRDSASRWSWDSLALSVW